MTKNNLWKMGVVLSLGALVSLFACTEKSTGGDKKEGVTPGGMWNSGGQGSSGPGVSFGTGQAASNNVTGTPGEVAAADCTAACNQIADCFGEELDASDLAECPGACAEQAVQAEIDCITSNSCDGILTACIDVETPASSADCSSACSKIEQCFGEYIEPGDMADCAPACAEEATSSEIQCVISSGCDAMLSDCFGMDEEFNNSGYNNPTNNPTNNVGDSDCRTACEVMEGCFGEVTAAEMEECISDCQAESTAAEVSCVINSGCGDLEDCFPDDFNNASNNGFNNNGGGVSMECEDACSMLVFECGAFPDEQFCWGSCAAWPSNIDDCVFETGCEGWSTCL